MKKKVLVPILILNILMPSALYAKTFTDVKSDHWAKTYIESLSDRQIIDGYEDGSFKPEKPVSFLESLKLISTALNPSQEDKEMAAKYFSVCQKYEIPDWAIDSVCLNLKYGTISEKTLEAAKSKNILNSRVYPSRNSIAVFIARALKLGDSNRELIYKDLDRIPEETKLKLGALIDAGIFEATGSDGNFEGDRFIKRSEMSKIISKMEEYLKNSDMSKTIVED